MPDITTPGVVDADRSTGNSDSSDRQESDVKNKFRSPPPAEKEKKSNGSSSDDAKSIKKKSIEQDHQKQQQYKKPGATKKKKSKGSISSDDAKSKMKFVSKAAAVLPGVEYIDSEVLAPRSEEQGSNVQKRAPQVKQSSNVKQPPASKSKKSRRDDAMVGAGIKAIPSRNTGTTRSGALNIKQPPASENRRLRRNDTKFGCGINATSSGNTSTTRSGALNVKQPPASKDRRLKRNDAKIGTGINAITSRNTNTTRPGAVQVQAGAPNKMPVRSSSRPVSSTTTHMESIAIEEDPEVQTASGETLQVLVATRVESQLKLVTAVATTDDAFQCCCLKVSKAKRLVLGACCLVLVALTVVVGLTVAFATGGRSGGRNDTTEIQVTQETFFVTIGGGPIDGTVDDGQYGVSVATNRDGSRIAVADLFGVQVYELSLKDPATYEMLGSYIQGDAVNAISFADRTSEYIQSLIRAPILTTMSRNGSFIAVAWPLHSKDDATINIGLVEVYQYDEESLSWEREGNSLFGEVSRDLFGFSLSLSEDGSSLAVGAAGNGGYAKVYRFDSGSWIQLGGTLTASQERLDIFSVTLSNDGTNLSVAGMPAAEDGAAAKVFDWFEGNWKERGSGIDGRTAIGETIYSADLSGDGNTLVVSNYYTTDATENTGEVLDVRAFIWSADTNDWEPFGQSLHSGNLAEKSGYFVSLSENGRKIAMGDPGTRVKGEGAVSGHAHFFGYKDGEWNQIGPNYQGEAAGDQFGYSVAISGNGDCLVASAPFNRALGEERGRVVVIQEAG